MVVMCLLGMNMRAEVCFGIFVDTPSTPQVVNVTIEEAMQGYKVIDCPECLGTGWWAFAEPGVPGDYCVQCKGTGKWYINV